MTEVPRQQIDGRRITLLLVDPQSLTREGLCRVLEEGEFAVVAQAADGESAVRLAERHGPDVAVLEVDLPRMSGTETTRQIRLNSPRTRVVMFTADGDTDNVCSSILAGACGYLLRDAGIEEITAGIHAAVRGESMLSPKAAATLIDEYRRIAGRDEDAMGEPVALTERELEVLRLLTAGRDNAEIAAILQVSVSTVKSQVSSVLDKLAVENRVQAAVKAVLLKLV